MDIHCGTGMLDGEADMGMHAGALGEHVGVNTAVRNLALGPWSCGGVDDREMEQGGQSVDDC